MIGDQPTDSPANREQPVDRERLRYITRLLGSPPGLNTALLGAFFLFMSAEGIVHWMNRWWGLLAGLVWLLVFVAGMRIFLAASERWIPEYYQRRFGSAQAAREPWSKWGARFFLAFLVLLLIGWPISHYLDLASRLHLMISDPGRQIDLSPSLLWIAAACDLECAKDCTSW